MNSTDHVSAASAESRKRMAGKQILQVYSVSVKKEVKCCKFKTEKQIEFMGEKLHPEVCGDVFSRRSPWTSSFASINPHEKSPARNPRSPLPTNTTQNSGNLQWALIFWGEKCCIFCCCCLETPKCQSFPATFPSL